MKLFFFSGESKFIFFQIKDISSHFFKVNIFITISIQFESNKFQNLINYKQKIAIINL